MDDAVVQSFAHGEVMVPGSEWWIGRMVQRTVHAVRWEVQRTKSHLICGVCAGCRTVIRTGEPCALCFIVRDALCCVACLLVIYVKHRPIVLIANRVEV
jgi:hypothetical protein